jgi:transposase
MLPAGVRIFVCTTPQDMRRSFDALALAARQLVGEDPQGGALFVFASKSAQRLKVLWWDRNGYCLLYKRLHRAIFEIPAASSSERPVVRIDGPQLAVILSGISRERRTKVLT